MVGGFYLSSKQIKSVLLCSILAGESEFHLNKLFCINLPSKTERGRERGRGETARVNENFIRSNSMQMLANKLLLELLYGKNVNYHHTTYTHFNSVTQNATKLKNKNAISIKLARFPDNLISV